MHSNTTVRDVMHREFVGVSESDTLGDAAELLLEEEADCLVVVRGGEPIGRLSPRDALAAVLDVENPSATNVGDVMAPASPTVSVDERLSAAEDRLLAEGASRLVATANGEAVGVVTERDLIAAARGPGEGEEFDFPSADETEAESAPEMTQSICEVCGSLSSELSRSNGQLVCPDCREV